MQRKKEERNEIKSTAHSKYRCQYHIVLAPYFNDETKSAPFYARQDEFPEAEWEEMVRRMVDQDSGAIYGFPGVEYSEIDNMDYMMYINQDWLDKLGLKMKKRIILQDSMVPCFD